MSRSGTWDLDACFAALADQTRRHIIRSLLHKPMRAGELARQAAVSPQALSRHLRVLREVGLVVEQGLDEDARVRVYSLRPVALQPIQEWLSQVEELWRRQLQSFKSYAESTYRARRTQ
jgi:DNA-binding transcriptional ArsR family regulator